MNSVHSPSFQTGRGELFQKGVTLRCNPTSIDVTFNLLAFPWLHDKNYHIHLNSSECVPYEITPTFIKIRAPFTGCGTIFVEYSHVIIYYNNLIAHMTEKLWPNLVITRVPDVVFPFKCAYERRKYLTQNYRIPVGG